MKILRFMKLVAVLKQEWTAQWSLLLQYSWGLPAMGLQHNSSSMLSYMSGTLRTTLLKVHYDIAPQVHQMSIGGTGSSRETRETRLMLDNVWSGLA